LVEFLEQYFYLNEEKEENKITFIPNGFLPQASLTEGASFTFEGNYYEVVKIAFLEDESGNKTGVKIILQEG